MSIPSRLVDGFGFQTYNNMQRNHFESSNFPCHNTWLIVAGVPIWRRFVARASEYHLSKASFTFTKSEKGMLIMSYPDSENLAMDHFHPDKLLRPGQVCSIPEYPPTHKQNRRHVIQSSMSLLCPRWVEYLCWTLGFLFSILT